jgi:hypothetical protein
MTAMSATKGNDRMSSMFRIVAGAAAALFVTGMLATAASADTSNTNTNSQTGSNTSTSIYTAMAVSGNATSIGGSSATSGDATARIEAGKFQGVFQSAKNQVAVGADACDCFGLGTDTNITNVNTNSQTFANLSTLGAEATAMSLDASAEDNSDSVTGSAQALIAALEEQVAHQSSINQGLFPDMEEGGP